MNLGEKLAKRTELVNTAATLLGVKYKLKAEWTDYSKIPDFLDCSEMIEGVFRSRGLSMPDGSFNQYPFCVPVAIELHRPGDLAFAGKDGHVDHVGLVYDDHQIIEARGFDEKASFKTGEVILRPIERWLAWNKFMGFRSHPELI